MDGQLKDDIIKIWKEVSRLEKENKTLKEENEALKRKTGSLPKNNWDVEFRRIDVCSSRDCIIKNGKIWFKLETDRGRIYDPMHIIRLLLNELNKT